MTTKDIIRYVWDIERKYNQGKAFTFFQDLKKAIEKEMGEGEEKGIYYKAYENLLWLKSRI